ncbi:MAG: signal transduction histidine kinase [Bradymonadia bacterium]|jgi:signal transduction histidine kinase
MPHGFDNRSVSVLHIEADENEHGPVERALNQDPRRSYHVATATSVTAALEALATGNPDVILFDVASGDGGPESSVKHLLEAARSIPIVVLTVNDEPELGARCVMWGAEEYLAKISLTPERLRLSLGYAVSRRQHRELAELDARLDSASRMASSVAHEINNPTAVIDGSMALIARRCELLRSELTKSEDTPSLVRDLAMELLGEIDEVVSRNRECVDRITTVVRSLEAFDRSNANQLAAIDVQDLATKAVQLANHETRWRAVTRLMVSDAPALIGMPDRLLRMLINLLVNAAQSMPEGDAEGNLVTVRTRAQDYGVIIDIADTGSGILPQHLPHIFKPFFTTRTEFAAPGLGLSVVEDIVHQHKGNITVNSTAGEGTLVRVFLPFKNGFRLPEPTPRMLEPTPAAPKHRRCILLVDDEPMLRDVTAQLLEIEYDVLTASNGLEALDCIDENPQIDLIVCDLMMPKLDGPDLYRVLLERAPRFCQRIVFVTGGAYTQDARAFIRDNDVTLLEKPFRRPVLVETIERQLGLADIVTHEPANSNLE